MKYSKFSLLLIFLSVLCISCGGQRAVVPKNLAALDALPGESIYGYTYRCKTFLKCINTLRASGKTSAVIALREYIQGSSANASPIQIRKLMYVCRLVFENPTGWPQLGLETSEPAVNRDIAKLFPTFPMAISDGVPFMLIDGYSFGGISFESGVTDVYQCQHLPIFKWKIPVSGCRPAAQKLVASENFQKLYKNINDRIKMTQEVLDQAGQ
jgi:hypothetical protein